MHYAEPARPSFIVGNRHASQHRARRGGWPAGGKSGDVATVTVHPAVWAIALDAADGDALRVEVLSPTEVRVHNRRPRSR